MYCDYCGKEIPDGSKFCPNCGKTLAVIPDTETVRPAEKPVDVTPEKPEPEQPAPVQPAPKVVFQQPVIQLPPEYKPISMWGYFGYEILYGLPFIGWIILIVMCFAPANKNVKNFARSYFCLLIILVIVLVVLLSALGISLSQFGNDLFRLLRNL